MGKTAWLLLTALLLLQYPLWFGSGSWPQVETIRLRVLEQRKLNERLRERNAQLAAEVHDLKTGADAVEERARYEFGLVKSGEILFHFVDGS